MNEVAALACHARVLAVVPTIPETRQLLEVAAHGSHSNHRDAHVVLQKSWPRLLEKP